NFYVPATNNPFSSSIDEITIDDDDPTDGPVALYDLAGRRITSGAPAAGIYIRQQGSKAQKLIIR
ncbi:MAG: hypothetical protein K2J09_06635, partial [Muribaculaceae bacterium]|nr:hypothetical protein [Muribaculaceae bacterium]